jgi:hypothetical protein
MAVSGIPALGSRARPCAADTIGVVRSDFATERMHESLETPMSAVWSKSDDRTFRRPLPHFGPSCRPTRITQLCGKADLRGWCENHIGRPSPAKDVKFGSGEVVRCSHISRPFGVLHLIACLSGVR